MLARSTSRLFVSSPDPPNALDSRTPQFASWIFRRRFAAFFFAKGRVRAEIEPEDARGLAPRRCRHKRALSRTRVASHEAVASPRRALASPRS
jgi:hypothetical protein